ncbi:MAG: F0F1 ATP synthase subunit gamma [Hoeflea sp.]|uniref:F0F1 ATP synthase subunit gamma n=1 Tax=Hoeflea sp. TaxID=1940281 RepID=UPI001D91AE06|nr:F0F1 ATP synthase subunit gamma [Hoeflea sp.]MBU4529281.1 F0F1 ATP synthase subunit gamma [Alphaproteobacteria bacterium]MBU4545448.1 F0F1 ATP synthase subunit gamma [Alphaproteobacteria bacterium]MBU4550163.1 F0F1 ATP synthase subunit gamma [Alphaproteobacteria bacterium]MBV1723204.1 F0F1 ATP synthase subunit gamma [Hoeflea sp.]MBV1782877.1 F0F1 ATP synthase subunit gamma [Hoeflea sp.]
METLESLSDALETTGDIQSIVRTMKALSSVSIRQYEQAEAAMASYAHTVELGLIAVLRQHRAAGLPLPGAGGGNGREALIVIGSDRGLCGGYNDKITRFALSKMGDQPMVLGVIGTRAAARLEAVERPADKVHSLPGSVEGLSRLVQTMIVDVDRWTREEGVGQVWLAHNRREGRNPAKPQAHRLLPLPDSYLRKLAQAEWPGRSLPLFRMDPEQLMSWLVQQRLFVVIYRALAEALASEHASRLAAMHAAERNIEERRDDLRQRYRLRRQETITRELLDVVSGFEAVSAVD